MAHANPQVRLAATENLVPYSTAEPAIFKTEDLKPITHMKLLIRDHPVSGRPGIFWKTPPKGTAYVGN
jgi:hypothetical protein